MMSGADNTDRNDNLRKLLLKLLSYVKPILCQRNIKTLSAEQWSQSTIILKDEILFVQKYHILSQIELTQTQL